MPKQNNVRRAMTSQNIYTKDTSYNRMGPGYMAKSKTNGMEGPLNSSRRVGPITGAKLPAQPKCFRVNGTNPRKTLLPLKDTGVLDNVYEALPKSAGTFLSKSATLAQEGVPKLLKGIQALDPKSPHYLMRRK
jgi:hypothetical protein